GLGNAFRLPGLQKFLSEKLQLEVRKLTKLHQVHGDVLTQPAFSENMLSFAVAYGLALQGMKLARIQTNLLPHEIPTERLIRAKKPWAVAACATLLLGTAGCAIGYALEYRSYTTEAVQSAMKESQGVVSTVKAKQQALKDQMTKVAAEETAVKSVIAGQDE